MDSLELIAFGGAPLALTPAFKCRRHISAKAVSVYPRLSGYPSQSGKSGGKE